MKKFFKQVLAILLTLIFCISNIHLFSYASNYTEDYEGTGHDLRLAVFLNSLESNRAKKTEYDLLEDGGFAIYPDSPTIIEYNVNIASQLPVENIEVEEITCYYNPAFTFLDNSDIQYELKENLTVNGKSYGVMAIKNIRLDNIELRKDIFLKFQTPYGYSDIFSDFYCQISIDSLTDDDSIPGNAIINGSFDTTEDDSEAFLNEYEFQACPYGLKYENTNGSLSIVDYIGNDVEDLFIPSKINGVNVVEIAKNSFSNKTGNLNKIFIPSSVDNILNNAFSNTTDNETPSMKEVLISEGVEWIGSFSFYNCTNLEKINFPSTISYISAANINSVKYYGSLLSYGLNLYYELPNPQLNEIKIINGSYSEEYFRNIKTSSGIETFSELLSKGEKVYTVNYDFSYNGGDWNSVETRPNQKGDSVDLSLTATKQGYTFVGWNTDPNATKGLSSLTMNSEDITLYAIYKKTLTATFVDYNNSSKRTRTVNTTIYNNDTQGTVTAPLQGNYSGWISKGWSTDIDANATNVNSYEIKSDTTYYGLYYRTLTLSYNANGGVNVPANKTGMQYTNSYAITSCQNPTFTLEKALTKTGYKFYAWAVDGINGTKYSAGSNITIKQNTTVYAVWSLDEYNLGEETYSFSNFGDSDSAGGHCFGMSITSSGYHIGELDITSIGGSSEKDLYSFSRTSAVKAPICYYQAIQGGYSLKSTVAGGYVYKNGYSNIESDWNEVINYVKEHEFDDKGTLQIGFRGSYMNYSGEIKTGGHAINFLRYEEVDGQPRIYAYDNNYPNTETYFYKDSNGRIKQAPYATFNISITCITLRSVPKYLSIADDFDLTRYIYADKDAIQIEGLDVYALEGDVELGERVMFEVPKNLSQITIIPLVDNAEFEYLNEEYSFGNVSDETTGIFSLSTTEEGTIIGNPVLEIINGEEISIDIRTPSTTTISYGDRIILHADITGTLPAGAYIDWTVNNDNFTRAVSDDGTEFTISPNKNGSTTITATVYDANGHVISSDEQVMTSKAGFFDKIIAFFKKLFGLTKTIPQIYKGIF